MAYLIPILWLLFCALFGVYDGLMYPDTREERIIIKGWHIPHKIAFIMRVVTSVIAFALPLIWWKCLIVIVAFGLMLPFIHTGSLLQFKRWNEKRLHPKTKTFQDKHFFSSVKGYDGPIWIRITAFITGLSSYVLTIVL